MEIVDPTHLVPILRVKKNTEYLYKWWWGVQAGCSSTIAQPLKKPLQLWSVWETKVLAEKRKLNTWITDAIQFWNDKKKKTDQKWRINIKMHCQSW